MSATFIKDVGSNFPVKKLEVYIKEGQFQTLATQPLKIYSSTGTSTFLPVYGYLQSFASALFTFNKLFLCDSQTIYTISYGQIDVQQLNGTTLDGGSIWAFNMYVNANGVSGIRNTYNRDTYLRANADDLAGVGDWYLIIYYLDIPNL